MPTPTPETHQPETQEDADRRENRDRPGLDAAPKDPETLALLNLLGKPTGETN